MDVKTGAKRIKPAELMYIYAFAIVARRWARLNALSKAVRLSRRKLCELPKTKRAREKHDGNGCKHIECSGFLTDSWEKVKISILVT